MRTLRYVLLAASAAVLASSGQVSALDKQIVAPAGSLIPGIPFSPAVRSGDLLYIAGTMATDASGKIVPGDLEAQSRRTLENIGAILQAGGMGFRDVVTVTVFLQDVRGMDTFAKVFRDTFKTSPPVMSVIQAELMLQDSVVEVSAIAADPRLPRQIVRPAGWKDNGLYSRAIKAGGYVFLAGLVPEDPKTGRAVIGDTGVQTRQILDNAKALVEGAGCTLADLTLARAWLVDGRDAARMNAVYKTYFGDTPPTRASTRTHLASPDYKVAIMFTGITGEKQRLGTVGGAPLSPAIKVGNRLDIAGLVQGGPEVRGDIKGQTRGILLQIQARLTEAGMTMDDVISASIFLSNPLNFDAMNEVYREFFKSDPPSRATVTVGLLPVDGLIEVSVIAAK